MAPRKSRAKPKEEVDADAPKIKRAPDIQWAKNPDWTHPHYIPRRPRYFPSNSFLIRQRATTTNNEMVGQRLFFNDDERPRRCQSHRLGFQCVLFFCSYLFFANKPFLAVSRFLRWQRQWQWQPEWAQTMHLALFGPAPLLPPSLSQQTPPARNIVPQRPWKGPKWRNSVSSFGPLVLLFLSYFIDFY